jgi:NADH-quinone oxidoreductase subunit L
VLAGLAIVAGALNLPFTKWWHHLEHWLEPALFENEAKLDVATGMKWGLAVIAILGAAIGILTAAATYLKGRLKASTFELGLFARGWYYDQAVSNFMGGPGRRFFDLVTAFDRKAIDGSVNGVGIGLRWVSGRLRVVQNGLVRSYAASVGVGAVALLAYFLMRSTF